MYAVDGGYVSFKLAFGNFDLWELNHGKDVSIFAMDSKPLRKEIYPEYKSQRIYGKTEAIQIVSDLRKYILEESKLPLCKIEGHEADDIIACWYLFNNDAIVTQDKDYFQLPNLEYTLTANLDHYHKQDVVDKSSKFIYEIAERNFALYQMLVGDNADGIPRILAKGKQGTEQVAEIIRAMNDDCLEACLLSLFEEKIILNAKLVLFPYYKFSSFAEDMFFNAWCDGVYYEKCYWWDYYDLIKDHLKPNKVSETLKQLELWGFE